WFLRPFGVVAGLPRPVRTGTREHRPSCGRMTGPSRGNRQARTWNGADRHSYQRQYHDGRIFGAFGRLPNLPLCIHSNIGKAQPGSAFGSFFGRLVGRITIAFEGSLVFPAASVAVTR